MIWKSLSREEGPCKGGVGSRRDKRPSSAVFIVLLVIVSLPAPAFSEPLPTARLRPGVFLFAIPEMQDPNFGQTVILLVDYNRSGALGLIINRPTNIPLDQALPHIEGVEELSLTLFFGGPVRRHFMSALLLSAEPPGEAQQVFDSVYFTGDREVLSRSLAGADPEKRVRIYRGYAGWSSGQLDREVQRGDWIIARPDSEMVFSEDPSQVWTQIFRIQEQIEIRAPWPGKLPTGRLLAARP